MINKNQTHYYPLFQTRLKIFFFEWMSAGTNNARPQEGSEELRNLQKKKYEELLEKNKDIEGLDTIIQDFQSWVNLSDEQLRDENFKFTRENIVDLIREEKKFICSTFKGGFQDMIDAFNHILIKYRENQNVKQCIAQKLEECFPLDPNCIPVNPPVAKIPNKSANKQQPPTPTPAPISEPKPTEPKPEMKTPEGTNLTPEQIEWRQRIHFTIDDGPHPNDVKIADQAEKKGVKVTFFWNGENFLNGDGKKELRKIKIGEPFPDINEIKKYIDPAKASIVGEVYKLAKQRPDLIKIGYHGIFHPASWNTEIGGNYVGLDKKISGKIENRSQLHLSKQPVDVIKKDIEFFEGLMQCAIGDSSYKVKYIRLPGSDRKMVGEEKINEIKGLGIEYVGWNSNSNDTNGSPVSIEQIYGLEGNALFHSKHFKPDTFTELDKHAEKIADTKSKKR